MSQIKKLIDRVTTSEARNLRDVVIPLNDAKLLRDELIKLLLDQRQSNDSEVIQVEMRGGGFK